MPKNLDSASKTAELDFTNVNACNDIIANAAAVQHEQLLAVASMIRQFLVKVNSEDLFWRAEKKKYFNDRVGQIFLQKLAITYVYYYAKGLEVKYFKNKLAVTSEATTAVRKFFEGIQDTPDFKFFVSLLKDEGTFVPNGTFGKGCKTASTFIDGVRTSNVMQTIFQNDDSTRTDSLNLDDLISNFSNIQVDKNDRVNLSKIKDFLFNADEPEGVEGIVRFYLNFYALVAYNYDNRSSFTINLENPDSFFHRAIKNLSKRSGDEDGKAYPIDMGKVVEDSLKKQGLVGRTLDMSTSSAVNDVLSKLKTSLAEVKEKLNSVKQNKDKPNQDQSVEDDKDLVNQLAMNMADYMTGKIDANTFQSRDFQIRHSNGQSMELNELEQ